jgi:hypothetical protein
MSKRKNRRLIESGKPHRFKPGKSGNPSGRPKSKTITAAYRKLLEGLVPKDRRGRTWAELIAAAQVRIAALGNVRAAREIADRTEGRPSQRLELTGDAGGPIEVADAREQLLEKLCPEALDRGEK